LEVEQGMQRVFQKKKKRKDDREVYNIREDITKGVNKE
jgi:hypothetical protein